LIGFSRKYTASFSTVSKRGFFVWRQPILRNVPNGTPLASAISSQCERDAIRLETTDSRMDVSMRAEGKPVCGFVQPGLGLKSPLFLAAVTTRRTKSQKAPSPLRELVARTVILLRDRKYRALPTVTDRNKALAKDADVSLSTIQRIVDAQAGASVDTLDSLAKALEVRPQDLLTPYFAASNMSLEIPQEPERLRRRQSR
jgi:DNA-binding Xre family transcriptional regulator